ncbi:hypothetical protein ZWY2020_017209 [Hordeum vulgare]|nr:hypothetical protein ZWY2020_017209 [Hordeum vulgare]
MATSPAKSRIRSSHGAPPPPLNEELIVDEILTRLPVAAAVRCRSVCRAWNAALASGHFVAAHAARAAAAAARHPEIVFFPPTERGVATTFYACSLPVDGGAAPTTARQLLTVGNLAGEHLVLSGKPCRGLTLVFDVRLSEYHLFNLSTGEHVSLPPCETAEEIAPLVPEPMRLRRFPVELSSTGLGFDPATGQHKVVRLFRNIFGQQKCEVCSLTASGEWRWRRCAGGDAPPRFACHVDGMPPVALDGSLYWLLHWRSCADDGSARDRQQHDAPILSLSVGAERFGWVRTPPKLASRIRHLTNLDGSLCAVVHVECLIDDVLLLLTWSPSSPSWSARCRVDMGSLPRPIRDELRGREVVPLCSVSGGQKIVLATSRHKVYVYDTESGDIDDVFDMNSYVDIPPRNSEARLFVNIGFHEEQIAGVGRTLAGDNGLEVKRGGDTVVAKRDVSPEVCQRHRQKDEDFRSIKGLIMEFAFSMQARLQC